MIPRSLLAALTLFACSPAAAPLASAPTGAREQLDLERASEALASRRHPGARLAPPFAGGTGTRRVANGEPRTALVTDR